MVLTPLASILQNGKHTQTIHWLLPTNCLNVFDYFVGLLLKVLISKLGCMISPYAMENMISVR